MAQTEQGLAEALEDAMRRRNLSPADLAEATGIPEGRLRPHLAHPQGFRLGDFHRVLWALDVDLVDVLS